MKEIIFEDNFKDGLDVGLIEENKKWNYMQMGPVIIGQEGFETRLENGIEVFPSGKNPKNDLPMFTTTAPGQADHMKWSINVNQTFGDIHGVEVKKDKTLNVEAIIGGAQYNTDQHPFGDVVENHNDDVRLVIPLLMMFDPVDMMVFDFALTNEKIYAIYERGKVMGDVMPQPVAYSFEIPLMQRNENENHLLRMAYNPQKNIISWYIDDNLVHSVGNVGKLTDRTDMYIDNGGDDNEVVVDVFNCGLGLLTLLDGSKNGSKGLVNLTGDDDYYNPSTGEPDKVEFVDDDGKDENKLFGQGVSLRCEMFRVYYD